MTTNAIVPTILGPQAERQLRRDVDLLTHLLDRLGEDDWSREPRPGGGTVLRTVEHLAEGAERLGEAWQARVEAEEPGPLLQPFDDPSAPPRVEASTDDPAEVRQRYAAGSRRLAHALSTATQDDWSWPVWSPLGGLETLAEAVRRWLAHHFVHRYDAGLALGLAADRDDETVRLVVEFVLDALARRGGDAVEPPVAFEVVTTLPGAGTWSVVFDEPQARREVDSVWRELVGHHPQAAEEHRIERGSPAGPRAHVRSDGETLWKAAFARGAAWRDLEVHGDDEGRAAWNALVERVAETTGGASLGAIG